ncbi:DUF4405 domain-containing protein [Neobacillus sp. D3-1R]|uniref:DUF4405 domain-containing protein n=1 Tax=Neobacillus sp. D3-1R TaxID=3445778 RepID=UPI003F9FE1CF
MKKNYLKIVLDLLMAITFVLLMEPKVLNGLPFHEIAGLVIGLAILIHIGLNYRWVITTTKKIFDPQLAKKTRISLLLNILLLLSMATVIITGIFISKVLFPNLAFTGGHEIREIHGLSADATLAIVGLHIGLHWQWILTICTKVFKTKDGKLRKGMIVAVIVSLAILTTGIQWYSTTSASNISDFKKEGEKNPFFDGKESHNLYTQSDDFHEGPPKGEFHRREGHGGNHNPFLVILTYFAIWGAIIVPTYYLEKRKLMKK